MAKNRSFKYLTFATDAETTLIKTPNGPSNFTTFTKSAVTVAGSATLTVNGCFIKEPAAEDLVEVLAATVIDTEVLTERIAAEVNRFPYLHFVYTPTLGVGDDHSTEVYVGFY